MKTIQMKTVQNGLFAFCVLAAAHCASGAPSVQVDSVIQRWPWNNKVDITYTVSGGQSLDGSGPYYKLVFTASINGTEYTVDGVTDVGANTATGSHTVTWDPPSGVCSRECTMRASLYDHDAPAGDDYMVVDLTTGAIAYEGRLASQALSNSRYDTDDYKTSKMVLRKVPAGTYVTGDNDYYPTVNSVKSWTTDKPYYIGIFPVTQGQYASLGLSNVAKKTDVIEGNTVAHRPMEYVSWNMLRGAAARPCDAVAADASSMSFFERLNGRTGKNGFDLPTELMWEIGCRAGAETTWFWGRSTSAELCNTYIVYKTTSGSSTVAVGSPRSPNNWGIWDTIGNVLEWCLDDETQENLSGAQDVWTPAWGGSSAKRRWRGAPDWSSANTGLNRASARGGANPATQQINVIGFRVAFVAK